MSPRDIQSDHDAARRVVTAIPCCQSSLFKFAANERGRVLLEYCPALAVLVVLSGEGQPGERRRLQWQELVALPWGEILTKLGLPARQETLRTLRKLPPEHCYVQTVQKLFQVLCTSSHSWQQVLPQLPRLTRDTVSLLRLDPSLVSPELLRASTESDWDVETVTWLVTGIRTLLLQLGHQGPWPYSGACVERLQLAEGELFARLSPDPAAFPTPPFAGRLGEIEPVRDLFDLAQEGEEVGNCAFVALLPEILNGEAFIYSVYHPERATLALRRKTALDEWAMHELLAPRNAEPAPTTIACVKAWFLFEKKNAAPEN